MSQTAQPAQQLDLAADTADLFIGGDQGKGDAAVSLARQYVQLPGASRHARLMHVLSYLFKDNWQLKEMGRALAAKLVVERSVLSEAEALAAGRLAVPRELHVLEHHAEQYEYLASVQVQPRRMKQLANSYRTVLSTMRGTGEGGTLDKQVYLDVQTTINRVVHLPSTVEAPAGALNGSLDWPGIERDYLAAQHSVVVVDSFLTAESLAAIRQFCLEATIWFDARSRCNH